MIDAGGKAIYPGFIDAHSHFYGLSLLSRYADLSDAASFDMVLDILRQQQENPGKLDYRPWLGSE
ncbi:MAG: amidohydrolase family protein [Bacteroidales bacterium]|nr:amidohydrolase family protein [Bacteroidales bacterium]